VPLTLFEFSSARASGPRRFTLTWTHSFLGARARWLPVNVNLLGPLALALENSKSVKGTLFPLFERIVELVAIVPQLP